MVRRRRMAATPTRTKTASDTALPIDARAPRSNTFTKSRVPTVVIQRPPWGPSREVLPNTAGNCPTSASAVVSPSEAYKVAVTDDAVASSAATAIAAKPASPRVGRTASAIAVGPYLMTWSTVRVPNTPRAMATYSTVVTPSARYIARGRFLLGFSRSPPVKLITAKPR